MNRILPALLYSLLVSRLGLAQPWSDAALPSAPPVRVFGGFAGGCIAGAASLPPTGIGYQAMRLSRNRYYGHPNLIAFLQQLGRAAAARGIGPVLIGDLGQPRGGPMSYGHRSHQSGLDVDIWFREASSQRTPTEDWRESLPMLSTVDAAAGSVLPERWGRRQRDLLFLAVQAPEVERVFVNPVIKLHLCRTEHAREWLRKLRPWWGHDEHFHVRLRCPPDSPACAPQKPFEAGDGCDEGLEHWVHDQQEATRHPRPPTPPPPPPVLPAACAAVFAAPAAER